MKTYKSFLLCIITGISLVLNASENSDDTSVDCACEIMDIVFSCETEDNEDQQLLLKKLFQDCYQSKDTTSCKRVITLMSHKTTNERKAAANIISSQQETIASQQNTIKSLSSTVDTYNEIEKRRTERLKNRREQRAAAMATRQ